MLRFIFDGENNNDKNNEINGDLVFAVDFFFIGW